jgi:hypothetical protein
MIKMARIKKNGVEIPRKILGSGWDALIDKPCLINGVTRAKLLAFCPDGRVLFKNKNHFIINLTDIESLCCP